MDYEPWTNLASRSVILTVGTATYGKALSDTRIRAVPSSKFHWETMSHRHIEHFLAHVGHIISKGTCKLTFHFALTLNILADVSLRQNPSLAGATGLPPLDLVCNTVVRRSDPLTVRLLLSSCLLFCGALLRAARAGPPSPRGCPSDPEGPFKTKHAAPAEASATRRTPPLARSTAGQAEH